MIATLICALVGYTAGVAAASATPPPTALKIFGPLLIALIFAALVGVA